MAREGGHDSRVAMLRRIVAMLFALSGLAERSTSRSRPVRRTLCWLFALVQSPVREMISGIASDFGLETDFSELDFARSNDSAEDLMRFAAALAELGRALQFLVLHLEQFAPPERSRVLDTITPRIAALIGVLMPGLDNVPVRKLYPDTS